MDNGLWHKDRVCIIVLLTHCIEATVLLDTISGVRLLVSTVLVLFLTVLILLDMTQNVLNPALHTVLSHANLLQHLSFL